MGAALAEQHDEWAEARPKGKSGGTEFAQPLLRNAGQLVCIDPSLRMADLYLKSAIAFWCTVLHPANDALSSMFGLGPYRR